MDVNMIAITYSNAAIKKDVVNHISVNLCYSKELSLSFSFSFYI